MKVKDLILEMTGIEIQDGQEGYKQTIEVTDSLLEALDREVLIENFGDSKYIMKIEEVKYDGERNAVIIEVEN